MNGDPAGLESADSSSKTSPVHGREAIREFRQTAEKLEAIGEYKAAREVHDAAQRFESLVQTREVGEGVRSGKEVHGEDSQAAKVTDRG
jgi:hypothetical protein